MIADTLIEKFLKAVTIIETTLYFVRHAESEFVEGKERTRGLSARGVKDAETIRSILSTEEIDIFVSSPYERSIETIRPTAVEQRKDIHVEEDLRERSIGDFAPATFHEAKQRVFEDVYYCYPNGESSMKAQNRAAEALSKILDANKGKKIAVGTHGDIMTLMLNHFDGQYGHAFWQSTSMPDIYKLRIEGAKLIELKRMWEAQP